MTLDGQTIVIPGPYGPGHPDYEIGFQHGLQDAPAVNRENETYMNGWSDGYIKREASTMPQTSDSRSS